MKFKTIEAEEKHKVAFNDLCELINKNGDTVSAEQLLAIAANMIGKLMALQDQRTMTPERAIEIVRINIEKGNLEAIASIHNVMGNG